MAPITLTICAGTACVVMDGSRLALLEEHLPAHLKGRVKLRGQGATRGPYVLVQGEPLAQASFERIAERIEALLAAGA